MPVRAIKWMAMLLGAAGLLLGATAMWLNDAHDVEALPTCVTFQSSGPSESMDKVMGELLAIARDGGLYATPEAPMSWTSVRAEMSYSASGMEPVSCQISVCSKNSDAHEWQDVAKKVEDVLRMNTDTVSASMQRSNREFNCHPRCVADVAVPIDFETLNRTLLVSSSP